MNKEIMRRHYEKTPKKTLINILISSREQVDKLQNRNKEHKQEIERLNNIINESNKMIDKIVEEVYKPVDKEWDNILCIIEDYKLKLQELKGSDKE